MVKEANKSFSHDTINSRLMKTEWFLPAPILSQFLICYMAKKLQLQVPTPCHENWENMTATGKGRFCASCQKQVIDFSNKSDREIVMFFKKPLLVPYAEDLWKTNWIVISIYLKKEFPG